MTESFCPSSADAQAMTDDEFWAAVADSMGPREEEVDEPDDEDFPEILAGQCLRCGGWIVVEDYEELQALRDADADSLCGDCADEVAEVPENDLWDVA